MSSPVLPTVSPDVLQKIVPKRYRKFALYLLCVLGVLAVLSLLSSLDWDGVHAVRDWSTFPQRPKPQRPQPQRPQPQKPQPQNLSNSPDYPPDYAEWHENEEALPQHNQSLPLPEGREGRYVYFSEHVKSTPVLTPIPSLSPGIPGG